MKAPRLPLRVVKVGGSLLAWPELPRAIPTWLAAQSPAVNVLLSGGGLLADVIRQADRDFSLGEESSHWLCIDTLAITAKLLAAILPGAPLVTTYLDLQDRLASQHSSTLVFDPREFLHAHEPHLPGTPLPRTWQATTDSIAARLAEILSAGELVLLKSSSPPAGDLAALATIGYVDRNFPVAARNVCQVRCINLRGGHFQPLPEVCPPS